MIDFHSLRLRPGVALVLSATLLPAIPQLLGECRSPSAENSGGWRGRGRWGERIQGKWRLRRLSPCASSRRTTGPTPKDFCEGTRGRRRAPFPPWPVSPASSTTASNQEYRSRVNSREDNQNSGGDISSMGRADHLLTRRACGARILALPATPLGLGAAAKHGGAIRSATLDFELQLANGKGASRRLKNRLVNGIIGRGCMRCTGHAPIPGLYRPARDLPESAAVIAKC